jgi:trehalose 2-sulfotransferase
MAAAVPSRFVETDMMGRTSGLISDRYDLNHGRSAERAYIVASSFRSGSTHLCQSLWQTGVMGAPLEYLNFENNMRPMAIRLGAKTPAEYLARLLVRRATRNGVFGLKAHFPHFKAALRRFPRMLKAMPPMRFIHIERKDKVAQAVSMAKALQTNAWISLTPPKEIPLFYSADLIAACMREIDKQTEGWTRWFETTGTDAYVVHYEDLLADRERVTGDIVRLLEAEHDEADTIHLPAVERQGDVVNAEWVRRFRADTETKLAPQQEAALAAG